MSLCQDHHIVIEDETRRQGVGLECMGAKNSSDREWDSS